MEKVMWDCPECGDRTYGAECPCSYPRLYVVRVFDHGWRVIAARDMEEAVEQGREIALEAHGRPAGFEVHRASFDECAAYEAAGFTCPKGEHR